MIVRDPVHGDIELTDEEVAVLDTAQFQRLRGVKQLGTAYLVFPGAVHSRFEHSVGVLHMAEQFIAAANRNAARAPERCRPVGDAERRLIRFAALLHDVTHIPFGHNIEDQTGLLARHDVPERFQRVLGDTELGGVLDRLGVRDDVLGVLAGGGRDLPQFCRQMLSDTIDADLLDYLRRDAHYTGLELRYDDRVREYFRVDRDSGRMFVDCAKHGMLREDIVSELTRVLEIRYHFSERVYYHHAKMAAGALLARMVELALSGGALTADALQISTDESLLGMLEQADLGDESRTARLARYVRRFRRRELPKRVIVLPFYLNEAVQDELLTTYFASDATARRAAWETDLEGEARRRFGKDIDITMYCPARRMQLKEARTLVRVPAGEIVELSELADDVPRLRDLQGAYPRLWKLYVFASESDQDIRRQLQEMCLAALPEGCVNALRI